jgi:hypothetical protein
MFSASSEARDRNAPTNANQIRLQTSSIRQEHRPIRYQLPAGLSFRQGQPTHQRLRLDDRYDLQDRREASIHQDEEPAVVICEPSPAFQLTAQDDQLMSEHRILRLKPALRLEWRCQHGQKKPNQREPTLKKSFGAEYCRGLRGHRANLVDSVS